MIPTPGPWIYDQPGKRVLADGQYRAVAVIVTGPGISENEEDANGYLLAAAPYIRDELTNLYHAVVRHTHAQRPDKEALLSALSQAGQALETIFPPVPEATHESRR